MMKHFLYYVLFITLLAPVALAQGGPYLVTVSNTDSNVSGPNRAQAYSEFVLPPFGLYSSSPTETFLIEDVLQTTFTAPNFIYLDSNGVTVGTEQSTNFTNAQQKVSCLGYKIDGGSLITGTSYTPVIEAGFTIEWVWSAPEVIGNLVQIETPYGASQMTPPSGSYDYSSGQIIEFSAPEFVYLDDKFKEISSSSAADIAQAVHRARCLGYVTNLTNFTGTDRTFRLPINSNMTITWVWQLEHALIINSDTVNVEGISPAQAAALGNPEPEVGKTWVPHGTLISAEMDGIVDPTSNITFGDSVSGQRFTIESYRLNGLRAITEGETLDSSLQSGRYYSVDASDSQGGDLQFQVETLKPDGTTEEVNFALTGAPIEQRDQNVFEHYSVVEQPLHSLASIGFWGKLDAKGTDGVVEGLMSLLSSSYSVHLSKEGAVMRLRSGSSNDLLLNPVILEMPASFFDDTWRYWTFSQIRRKDGTFLTTAFRDGDLIAQSDANFLEFDGDSVYNYMRFGVVDSTVNGVYARSQSSFHDFRATNASFLPSVNTDLDYINAMQGFTLGAAKVNATTSPVIPNSQFAQMENGYGYSPESLTASAYQSTPNLYSTSDFPDEVRLLLPELYVFNFEEAQSRVNTLQFPMNGSLTLDWIWDVEYRYTMATYGDNENSFDTLPYMQVFPEGTSQQDAQSNVVAAEATHFGSGLVWLPEGKTVILGSSYRAPDRRYTLSDFQNTPTGNLRNVGTDINNAIDESHPGGAVSRAYYIPTVTRATNVNWYYLPTTFRAVVPVGEYLDASWQDANNVALSPLPANTQFFPDLPDGTRLKIDRDGPVLAKITESEVEGVDLTGSPIQWDFIGKRLWPTKPYSMNLNWEASNGEESFNIELVSGWPNTPVTVPPSTPFEDDNGNRLLASATPKDYVLTQTTAETSESFPGHPTAHYSFLYDELAEKSPPLELDSNDADRWNFKEMTFTETSGARPDVTAPHNYSVSEGGKSVLVYNYHPDEQSVATGNPSVEAYTVRVIEGESLTEYRATGNTNVPQEVNVGGGVLPLHSTAIIGTPTAGLLADFNDNDFALDFWFNAQSVGDTTVNLFSFPTDQLNVNLTGNGNLSNDGTLEIQIGGATVTIPKVVLTGWHHYSFNFFKELGVNGLRVYQDGVLLAESDGGLYTDISYSSSNVVFMAGFTSGGWSGWVDNLRCFGQSSTRAEARQNRYFYDSNATTTLFQYSFDNGDFPPIFIPAASAFSTPYDGRSQAGIQEVAQPISSYLDQANFESGWVTNAISNYNQGIYNRGANVGQWGRIFPVNDQALYAAQNTQLEVVYYRNSTLSGTSYLIAADGSMQSQDLLHPNVAFPYYLQNQNEVGYPQYSQDEQSRIYIASRVGSEGVSSNGLQQRIFKTDSYANLSIYNQSDRAQAGFNPNEEHALVNTSVRGALTQEATTNIPPNAAFALQNSFNRTDTSILTGEETYTSHPWVLVQYDDLEAGRPEMKAYKVERERSGTVDFPTYDLVSNEVLNPYPTGEAVEGEGYDFTYSFNYRIKAGDLLIPMYPLNLVIGAAATPGASGGNYQVNTVNQRTLWWDYKGNPYAVSGDGGFFYRYVYPFRSDFDMAGRSDVAVGDLVAFLPETAEYKVDVSAAETNVRPERVNYRSFWDSDYPKLKRGETLTYQGGEYKADHPSAEGLPALVSMASAEVVYDSVIPDMIINSTKLNQFAARVVRPLDVHEVSFPLEDMPEGLQPAATDNVMVDGARWYFRQLTGSLSKRFYYDSLNQKLVLRGRLNGRESGDADLTSGIEALNVLEPNFISEGEYLTLRNQPAGYTFPTGSASSTPIGKWFSAVETLYTLSTNPEQFERPNTSGAVPASVVISPSDPQFGYFPGLALGDQSSHLAAERERMSRTFYDSSGNIVAQSQVGGYKPLTSFGVGSALVAGAEALLASSAEKKYVTIAENNDERLNGAAVSIHIVELVPERYRGGLKVIEPRDAFSERINIQHNGEFGGNSQDIYYEWYIREAASLDVVANEISTVGTASQDVDWQLLQSGVGLHAIDFEGRPDIALVDQLFLMRYRHKDEPNNWNLVSLDSSQRTDWEPAHAPGTASTLPFQWVGAANSPQLQADGSKRYIPQLVMGWVKRVLDRINPYEARYNDFYNNESPATYTSIIQSLGSPFIGSVALNSDKDVIEGVGLIELYETVLKRARDLTIDNSQPTQGAGINQALLLAATRLSTFYDILGTEAYADFLDPNIQLDDTASALSSASSYVHSFQNLEPNVISEGLSLLRGTDFITSYPSYNRLFWNYTKGLGEAAYNTNYNITDENLDGFINEEDARALYPQGHGDAWGHYLSASNMHYELLNHATFSWRSRDELYALLDNVIEVDFLDEKSFIKNAARKSRAGRDIVAETYRNSYTHSPDGQWQGYEDNNEARAWGVGEWGRRAGQAAHFDFLVGNALLPESATETLQVENADPSLSAEGVALIERKAAVDELGEISSHLLAIQTTIDQAAIGANPIGLQNDAISFDIDPYLVSRGQTHFDQVYAKALEACQNTVRATSIATQAKSKLRQIEDYTTEITASAYDNDLAIRQKLVRIYGQPHPENVGFGKLYPEGYKGPDLYLYNYIEQTAVESYYPTFSDPRSDDKEEDGIFVKILNEYRPSYVGTGFNRADDGDDVTNSLYESVFDDNNGNSSRWSGRFSNDIQYFYNASLGIDSSEVDTYYQEATVLNDLALLSDSSWSSRPSYGELQQLLEEITIAEIKLSDVQGEYLGFLDDVKLALYQLENSVEIADRILANSSDYRRDSNIIKSLGLIADNVSIISSTVADAIDASGDSVSLGIPEIFGFSASAGAPAKGAVSGTFNLLRVPFVVGAGVADFASLNLGFAADIVEQDFEEDSEEIEVLGSVQEALANIYDTTGADREIRYRFAERARTLELLRQKYLAKLNEGVAALNERESFNSGLAADVQRNRYQDMMLRIVRNESQEKFKATYENAQRYVWLAAKAYEYEVNPAEGSPASAIPLLDKVVQSSSVGNMINGEPTIDGGGLSEILAMLKANHTALKGQLGINNPQVGEESISLRKELFRIGETAASKNQWKRALGVRRVDNLWDLPEYKTYCRPFGDASQAEPALLLKFNSTIQSGLNFFGLELSEGDHAFSTSNYSTKISGVGVWFEGYDTTGLAATPRIYLVPTGADFMRTSDNMSPQIRGWSLLEQAIPTPYTLNETDLTSPSYIPRFDGVDGSIGDLRRFGDFRAYSLGSSSGSVSSQMIKDTRLVGRSVWNGEWMIIIPGRTLHSDPEVGIDTFIDNISDITLNFETFTHRGL